ncbi:hypothetical protein NC99_22380 [Sunxiuqinia dokdonensis]|uniref:Uncharacterized protein n=1 Tax=Sunxiuqinia dokdonensis TaxID=1409788 RepID=A0A0L8V8Z9_9BACT|nr:hypothetical protein NC99_22380 [Sunxiuqinia dokdonensis]
MEINIRSGECLFLLVLVFYRLDLENDQTLDFFLSFRAFFDGSFASVFVF